MGKVNGFFKTTGNGIITLILFGCVQKLKKGPEKQATATPFPERRHHEFKN